MTQYTYTLEKETAQDGTPLAVHVWIPELQAPRGLAFYCHGIQSHGGWLYETGPQLASRGLVVVCMDRRGSGLSGGPRGDVDSYRTWLADYSLVYEIFAQRYADLPNSLVGWSMGGSLVAGLLTAEHPLQPDSVIFSAPGLGQHVMRLDNAQKEQRRADRGHQLSIELHIDNRKYTTVPEFLDFLESDALMQRNVSPAFRLEQLRLDEHSISRASCGQMPASAMLTPENDEIVVLEYSEIVYRKLAGSSANIVKTGAESHLIEFSSWRARYWDFVAAFVEARGAPHAFSSY